MPPTSTHATLSRGRAEIRLRRVALDQAAKDAGIETVSALADHLGVDRSNFHKVRRGVIRPGEEFIAAVLGAFPSRTFEDLFELGQA